MNTILLIHGPNLNRLGTRDPQLYGTLTLDALQQQTRATAQALGYIIRAFQSNHEGALIDWLQENASTAAGIIMNPGALGHYSYALYDALLDTKLPCLEVHLSDIHARESWRAHSVIAPACIAQVSGKKEQGYQEAVKILAEHLKRVNESVVSS
ncbi:3-dehydroquinate dehydratase [Candidatus Uhrbacteria bacterium]|nr:3-dehydroquinate dehydratase [Candidatus Uhrbacteria bacterium]